MIPNNYPCYHTHSGLDVIAWSDEGRPLVLDVKTGNLAQVSGPLTEDDRFVQLIPATGWQVTHNPGTDDEFTQPLVAWGLRSSGSVAPLDSDCNGLVEEVSGQSFLITPVVPAPEDQ